MRMKKLARPSGSLVVGVDQSANGTAAVSLLDGKLRDVLVFADTKTRAKEVVRRFPDATVVEPLGGKLDPEVHKVLRLRRLRAHLSRFLAATNPSHVAFEAYALTKAPLASRTLGEVGAVVRLCCVDAGVPYHVYEVDSIKMFATGKGNAEKADVVLACRDAWERLNFLEYGKTDGAGGNVADAYVIAQMLHLNLLVRSGAVELSSVAAQERAVLQRTTPKKQPVCILEMPFVEVPR